MRRVVKKSLLAVLFVCMATPTFAVGSDEPGAAAMALDLLVARPFGLIITTVGTAVFLVSLPFSAAGGNVNNASEKLVLGPARETFVRCLGCKTTGRYIEPDR